MRVALIRSSGSSAWQSCFSITYNLTRAYKGLPGHETREFALNSAAMDAQIHEIHEFAPDVLAVIDYGSFQPAFLKAWTGSDDADRAPIFLHCFGDFPLAACEWVELAPKLLGLPIRFIAASDASAELIAELLSRESGASEADSVSIVPFPIDAANFRPAPKEGRALRRSLGLEARDFVLLYTGRISLQKNATTLARLARDYAVKRKVSLTLAFAGEVDDIGADFLGIDLAHGFYREHFNNELAAALKGGSLRIAMLGNLGPDELRHAYNAADAFVSLSMHHDEDFGMSPGEALCCGTPVILSGWGGFHSFPAHVPEELRSEAARLIGLESSGSNISVRAKVFFEALDHRRKGPPASELRARLARGAASSLSIEAARPRLERLLGQESPSFTGFSQLFDRIAGLMRAPGRFRSRRFDDPRYRRLYAPYFSPTSLQPKQARAAKRTESAARPALAGETTLQLSALTGFPCLRKGIEPLRVIPAEKEGCLDLVFLGSDALEIHAWCADLVEERAPSEVCVFRNAERLPGSAVFKMRTDVQEELGRNVDRTFRPGFEFRVPREKLGEVRARDVYWVFGLFDTGLAMYLGQFRLNPRTDQAGILPHRNRAIGTYVPVELGNGSLELYPQGREKPSTRFGVLEEAARPPASVAAFLVLEGRDRALVFPANERKQRPPRVRGKAYALFDSGVALELT